MSSELDYIDRKLNELMDDDYLLEVTIVAILIDGESGNYSVTGNGCSVCASKLLIKYITDHKVEHNDE